jgi:hypothetical protein
MCGTQANKVEKSSPETARYLALVLKLGACESCVEIEKAAEVSGRLVSRDVRSSLIFEITEKEKTFFVGSLPDDLLSAHGFSFPSQHGESNSKTQSSTIPMYVPGIGLSTATEGSVSLKIFASKSGCCIERATLEEFKKLKDEGRLSLRWYLSEDRFASQVRRAISK